MWQIVLRLLNYAGSVYSLISGSLADFLQARERDLQIIARVPQRCCLLSVPVRLLASLTEAFCASRSQGYLGQRMMLHLRKKRGFLSQTSNNKSETRVLFKHPKNQRLSLLTFPPERSVDLSTGPLAGGLVTPGVGQMTASGCAVETCHPNEDWNSPETEALWLLWC